MDRKIIVFISGLGIIILGFVFLRIFNHQTVNEKENNEINEKPNYPKDASNSAILYFSATGTTKTVAQYISNATNGDMIEIVPKDNYTSSDLNYNDENCRANQEQRNERARPELDHKIEVSKYDVVYLGYPIWWGDLPKIILTFLDNTDLQGKTVIPFCTSGGSEIDTSLQTLSTYNSNIHWISGKRLSPNEQEVISWINGLTY